MLELYTAFVWLWIKSPSISGHPVTRKICFHWGTCRGDLKEGHGDQNNPPTKEMDKLGLFSSEERQSEVLIEVYKNHVGLDK